MGNRSLSTNACLIIRSLLNAFNLKREAAKGEHKQVMIALLGKLDIKTRAGA